MHVSTFTCLALHYAFQHTAKTSSLEAMSRHVKKSGTIREPIEALNGVRWRIPCHLYHSQNAFQKTSEMF